MEIFKQALEIVTILTITAGTIGLIGFSCMWLWDRDIPMWLKCILTYLDFSIIGTVYIMVVIYLSNRWF